MAIDFPSSPTLNQTFTVGNTNYVWDGTKWTASVTGGIALDKITEGDTSAEVIDTGSDGRFVVTTEGTEALRVDNQQRVGIGTASPSAELHVKSADVASIKVESGGTSDAQIDLIAGNHTNPFSIVTNTSRDFIVQDLYTERLRISSTGAVALNATANYGTSGQVLTSQGSGAAPQWATPAGGLWTYISSVTASNSASVAFTSGIDSTYDLYVIKYIDFTTTTINRQLYARTSSNGGSTWDSGASDYVDNGTTRNYFRVAGNYAALDARCGHIYLWTPSDTSYYKRMMVYRDDAETYAVRNSSSAINAIQFFAEGGGNIVTGIFHLYGVKNS